MKTSSIFLSFSCIFLASLSAYARSADDLVFECEKSGKMERTRYVILQNGRGGSYEVHKSISTLDLTGIDINNPKAQMRTKGEDLLKNADCKSKKGSVSCFTDHRIADGNLDEYLFQKNPDNKTYSIIHRSEASMMWGGGVNEEVLKNSIACEYP